MVEMEKALYVGCSLTTAPDEFKDGVQDLKEKLRGLGYEVLEFKGLVDGTAEDVFRWDIEECVSKCGAMLAIVDFPSIGLGWEMAVAGELAIPTLAVAQEDSLVSRLVLGAAEVLPNFEFERYDMLEEVPTQFDDFLERKLG